MPTKQRYNMVTSAFRAFLFLLFFPFLSAFSHAADLGRLTVLSSIGQPLRAEVELLSVSPAEASSLSVSPAREEAYKRSGVNYTSTLQSLKISLEKESNRHFVSIRSTQPVSEPYIGIVLELSVNGERKEREYAITLDPAEWTNLRSAPLSSAASMQKLSKQQHAGKIGRALPVTAARPASILGEKGTTALTARTVSTGQTEHVVAEGESLSKIAMRLGQTDISLEQMLVVLYRNNPHAFFEGNMNLLRKGAVLSIPDMSTAGDVPQQDAQQMVKLHAASFRRYSEKLASMVQDSKPGDATKTVPVAEGKISTSVQEVPTPVSKSPDRLELSKARSDSAPANITVEEKVAMQKAIEDANLRITELEKNVSELKKLLDVVSKSGHTLTKPAEAPPVTSTETEKPPQPEAAQPQKAAPKDEPAEKTEASGDAPSSARTAKKEGIGQDLTLGGPEKKAEKSEKKEADEEDEKPDRKREFLHNLKNNTVWHMAAGITAALVFLIAILKRVRRKKEAPPPRRAAAVSSPPPEKKEKETQPVNPNIISGRDFLENMTGRKYVDEEDEISYDAVVGDERDLIKHEAVEAVKAVEEVEAIKAIEKAEAIEAVEEVVADSAEEKITEETVSEPEKEQTAQKIVVAPEEALMVEETAVRPEEKKTVEEVAVEPEVQAVEDIVTESAKEEVVEKVAAVSEEVAKNLDDDFSLLALQLDDSDKPSDEDGEKEEHSERLELDLSDISLEPDVASGNTLPDMAPAATADAVEPFSAEMEVKLELALAYIDMKDKEGARELLEEIIARGTPRQVAEARQALQSL